MLTHRRSKGRLNRDFVMLFAEEGNEHFGTHVWVLRSELPRADQDKLVEFAMEFYDVDDWDVADALVDPPDIVDTAGAWDDPDFVESVYARFLEPGYVTQDGAVVLAPAEVDLDYYVVTEDGDEGIWEIEEE